MRDEECLAQAPSLATMAELSISVASLGDGASAIAGRRTPVAVTAFLMCSDNMPSGTAIGLGDVLHIRGGATVEVMDTDAEGRLIMADGLVPVAEEKPQAIIDMATPTGSVAHAPGPDVAWLLANNEGLSARLRAAGKAAGEPLWALPLN